MHERHMFHPFSIFANVVRDKSWILGLRQRWTACAVQTCSTHLCHLTFFVVSKIYSVFSFQVDPSGNIPHLGSVQNSTAANIDHEHVFLFKERDSTLKHDVLKQFFEVLFQPCSIIAPRSRPQVDHVSSRWPHCDEAVNLAICPESRKGTSSCEQNLRFPSKSGGFYQTLGQSLISSNHQWFHWVSYKPLLSVFWRLCRVFWGGIKIRSSWL